MPQFRPCKYALLILSIACVAFLLLSKLLSTDIFIDESDPDFDLSTEQAADYCNFASEVATGDEGVHPADVELVGVIVVLRHGDRYHMASSRLGSLRAPPASCQLSPFGGSHQPVASFMADMNKLIRSGRRVGSRAPGTSAARWDYLPYPNSTVCRPEQLTPAGVEQHLRNGIFLRRAYQKKIKLYRVLVKSTSFVRTYQSALAFLYGLNRKLNWERLDIEKVDTYYFCSGGACDCPRVATLRATARNRVEAEWREQDASYRAFADRVRDVLGSAALRDSNYPWESAFDLLAQFACRRLDLACARRGGKCFSEADVDLAWRHLTFHQRKLATSKEHVTASRIEIQPLLADMALHLKARLDADAGAEPASSAEGGSGNRGVRPPIIVYSAHDVTLMPLAVALGVPLGKWPPYASRLVVEQYRSTGDGNGNNGGNDGDGEGTWQQQQRTYWQPQAVQKQRQHYVRVLFNGEDVTRWLSVCQLADNGLCSLEDFVAFAEYKNLRQLGYHSWRAACSDERLNPLVNDVDLLLDMLQEFA